MKLASRIAVALVAVLHASFFALEAVFWQTDAVRDAFQMSAEKAADTAVLAMNQGAYNLALAVGLVVALVHPSPVAARLLTRFVLVAIIALSVVGAVTGGAGILVIQGVPAMIALALTERANRDPASGN
ncbi:MAG: DUF1304 domain-containing protein [Sandaracinaceae bacterium]